jgi:RNA polymerase sigma factor (sigma-70 family)
MSTARASSGHHGGRRNVTSDAPQFLSDEALVAGAKSGQGSFFGELHERHRERMFRVTRRITRHHEDAQDAVQESFLSAYIHLKKFDERARFSTWLTRIAINAALMKVRKNRASRQVGVEDAVDTAELSGSVPNPEEICARTEQKAALRNAIAKLRPCRSTLCMKPRKHSGPPSRQRKRDCFMREPHYAGQHKPKSATEAFEHFTMECCMEQLFRLPTTRILAWSICWLALLPEPIGITSCKPTPRTYPHDAQLDYFRIADDSARAATRKHP